MKKSLNPRLTLAGGCAITLVAGFVLIRLAHHHYGLASSAKRHPSAVDAQAAANPPAAHPHDLAAQIDRLLGAASMSDPSESESVRQFVTGLDGSAVRRLLEEPGRFFPRGLPPVFRQALLARWTVLQPAEAAAFVQKFHDTGGALIVFKTWVDVDAASAWARKQIDPRFAAAILRQGGRDSLPPRVALALLDKPPLDGTASYPAPAVLARASDADIKAWLREAPESPIKTATTASFCQLQPERARALVLDHLAEIPASADRIQLVNLLLPEWAKKNPMEVVAWLDKQPDAPLKTGAWASLIAAWAETNPAMAARIASEMNPGPAQRESVISAVSGWARVDPIAASRWVAGFPEGDLHRDAVEQLVSAWAQKDPLSASQWIVTLRPGSTKDLALKLYASLNRPGTP